MTKSKYQRSHVRIKYKLLKVTALWLKCKRSKVRDGRLNSNIKDVMQEILMQMSNTTGERLSADVKDDRQEISMQMSKLSNERLSADVKDDRF